MGSSLLRKIQNKGYVLRLALCGGNWNNDLNCGPFYVNLNNTASNSNSNNGAALPYPYKVPSRTLQLLMQYISLLDAVKERRPVCCLSFPHRLVKINSVQASVSNEKAKADERIREK